MSKKEKREVGSGYCCPGCGEQYKTKGLQKEITRLEKENIEVDQVASDRLLVIWQLKEDKKRLREALGELMAGVNSLPPLTAIEGLLTSQCTKAVKALKGETRSKSVIRREAIQKGETSI